VHTPLLALRMGANDLGFEIVDRLVEPIKRLGQNLHARPGGVRKRRIFFGQFVDAAHAF
jgi:hypothetical protein